MKIDTRTYVNVHYWLIKKYGNANRCDMCNTTIAKRYEWALKKGFEYSKDINCFMPLCKSCHVKYDMPEDFSEKLKIANTGKVLTESTKAKMSESAKKRKTFNINNLKPQKPIDAITIEMLNEMYNEGYKISDICSKLCITKPTLYKYLNSKQHYSKNK